MEKRTVCEGIVEKVKFPNKGIVKVEDSEVTVKNTIPGQKVSFVINEKTERKSRRTSVRDSGKIRIRAGGAKLPTLRCLWRM